MAGPQGRKLRCAMVGGGRDAFIGAVHRHAMALDGTIDLVAGALSSVAEKALASGRDLGLRAERNHASWQALLANELSLGAEERIDFVSIVTPNDVHHGVAKAFAEAGIHVVCDKPLVPTSAQADELVRIVRQRGIVFGVTYNYCGYPMVRQAREMVKTGVLGDIRKVVVEYHQGWLATRVESDGNKQADWRTDPTRSVAGAIADIGSHAENLVATVTGLSIESLCADLHAFIPGRRLDDDASLLLRFAGGARGVRPDARTTCACASSAAAECSTGARKIRTRWFTRRSIRLARSSAAARRGSARRRVGPVDCRAVTRRASSKPSPMSTPASPPRSGRACRASRPIRSPPTMRTSRQALAAFDSSRRRWPPQGASASGPLWPTAAGPEGLVSLLAIAGHRSDSASCVPRPAKAPAKPRRSQACTRGDSMTALRKACASRP
jgi:predicted dehydrogenase